MTGTVCPAASMGVSHSLSMAAPIIVCTSMLASVFCAWYGPKMLARTAAESSALTWLNMKTYAVCRSVSPTRPAIAPKSGARCADTGGSAELPDPTDTEEVFIRATNGLRASAASLGAEDAKERSQMESSARPWAVEARLPTVQTMAASSRSSSSVTDAGERCDARTKGRVVEA